jgi:nicotinamidase-related amidase
LLRKALDISDETGWHICHAEFLGVLARGLAGLGQLDAFAEGMWGGDWHSELVPQPGDVVIQEHWGQNGFANTDLDLQLKQRSIEKIILAGMMANTCIEATARYGAELGYHVTLVRDATAAFSSEAMHAAHEINGPAFAHAILATDAIIAALVKA